MRRTLPLLIAAFACFRCGGEELEPARYSVPGCEHLDGAPCDVRDPTCQDRLFRVAACLRGEDPGTIPVSKVVTEDEYAREVLERIDRITRPDPDHWENALVTLQLVAPGAFQPMRRVSEQAQLIAGFYRSDTKEIAIVDHGEANVDPLVSAIFVHESIHALQDRAVPLDGFIEQHGDSEDAQLAARSIVEGEARLHESLYLAYALGIDPSRVDWMKHFQEETDRSEEWVWMETSRLLAGDRSFPYAWGARYLHFVRAAEGQAGIGGRFVSPPSTTHLLLASVDAAFAPELVPVEVEPPVAPAEWTFVGDSSFGAWNVLLMLATMAGNAEAHELALAWRGDRMSVFGQPNRTTGVVWKIELAGEAQAARAAALMRARFGAEVVEQQGARVVFASSDAGAPLTWAF